MNNKLYRSRTDRVLGGVCGGLGRYLAVDPVIIRLFFILLAFGQGVGALIYLLMWIIIPVEGQASAASVQESVRAGAQEMAARAQDMGNDVRAAVQAPNPRAGLLIGATLIILGAVLLAQNVLESLNIAWLRWFGFDTLWPLLLIIGGLVLLWRRARED